MSTFINPTFILVFFILIRAGDLAISAAIARDTIRAICYAIASILAMIFVVLTLVGH